MNNNQLVECLILHCEDFSSSEVRMDLRRLNVLFNIARSWFWDEEVFHDVNYRLPEYDLFIITDGGQSHVFSTHFEQIKNKSESSDDIRFEYFVIDSFILLEKNGLWYKLHKVFHNRFLLTVIFLS